MLKLLTLWFGISVPLVFMGAYAGYRQEPLAFPVVTSNIPKQVRELGDTERGGEGDTIIQYPYT